MIRQTVEYLHDYTCTHTHRGVYRHKQGWFHGELLLKPHRATSSEGPLLGLRVLIILFLDMCFVSEVCGMLECVHEQIFGYTPLAYGVGNAPQARSSVYLKDSVGLNVRMRVMHYAYNQ